ncbi:hypothetical protein Tco_0440828, partial [Tanacetum coccineum]
DAIEFITELIDKKICSFAEQQRSGEKKPSKDLNLCAQNATITMTVNVLQNATRATELAIWLVTVGVLQIPTLLTTKGTLGQVRNLIAMNVEPMDISRRSVQS